MEKEEGVATIYGRPRDSAALATATSPSGWAIVATPMGARRIGAGGIVLNRLMERSRIDEELSIRGTNRHRSKDSRFSRTVFREPAPPSMNPNGPFGSFRAAWRSHSSGETGH